VVLLAAPVYYTLEAAVGLLDRATPIAEAPAEVEVPPVAGAPVERPVEAEPSTVDSPPPVPSVAQVSGSLRAAHGVPVPNGRVELRSHAERYAATSNARGHFSIPRVEVGGGYELSVDTEGRYRDLRAVVDVLDDGLQLDLLLEPLARAVVVGRMIDPDGAPLPGRTVTVRVGDDRNDALHVTGDARGRFRVDDAPTGRLAFLARTRSRLEIQGPLLHPGDEVEVTLVLDEGDHELRGRVVEDHGAPVPGANLKLSWIDREGDLPSRSTRTTVTAPDGSFRFSALASGPHQLEVSARGYERARETIEVPWNAGETELRLRPRSRERGPLPDAARP